MALGRHTAYRRLNNFPHHAIVNFRSNHRCGRISPHSAGVGTGITIITGLVVLGSGHGQDMFPVHHDDETGFFASQKFLDDHAMSGFPKGVAGQHILHRRNGFLLRFGKDHTLAGRQTVSLNDDRRTLLPDIGDGFFHIGEISIGGGGYVMPGEKILGKGLGAFQLRGSSCGTKAMQVGSLEGIDHSQHQRGFGTDNGQIDLFVFGKLGQDRNVISSDSDIFEFRFMGRTGITRCHVYDLHVFRLGCFPGQGMLTPAATNDQNLHVHPHMVSR